jgi:hypothetical protein
MGHSQQIADGLCVTQSSEISAKKKIALAALAHPILAFLVARFALGFVGTETRLSPKFGKHIEQRCCFKREKKSCFVALTGNGVMKDRHIADVSESFSYLVRW